MKKKITGLLIIFYLCGLLGVFSPLAQPRQPFAYPYRSSVVLAYAANETVIKSLDEFYEAVKGYTDKVTEEFSLTVVSSIDMEKATDKIVNDTKYGVASLKTSYEYFTDASGKRLQSSKYTYEFTVKYRDDVRIIKAFNDKEYAAGLSKRDKDLLKKAKSIIANQITKEMSDFEKVLAIHDYLVLNGEYDTRVNSGSLPEVSYEASGLLLDGKGVCSAYATSMRMLLEMAGVECIYVTGTGKKEAHGWNKVKIDDKWYNIDTTWNDPTPDEPGEISYAHFCMTDAEFTKSQHKWDNTDLPKATSLEHNYYRYYNLVAENYTEFKAIITDAVNEQKGQSEIKVKLYVKNYDPKKFKFDFITDLVKSANSVKYTDLQGTEGEMVITVSLKP